MKEKQKNCSEEPENFWNTQKASYRGNKIIQFQNNFQKIRNSGQGAKFFFQYLLSFLPEIKSNQDVFHELLTPFFLDLRSSLFS
ncbi:MAG TPA: hypothetical protein DCW97_04285 [Acidobacteria bacterium]|nr:hypothetical protein [Acidobacteriota bacterium]